MTTRTTPRTVPTIGRGVHIHAKTSDSGICFDENGNILNEFDVTEMEEIETLDGYWVYRNALDNDDDPGIKVSFNILGVYRNVPKYRVRD